MSDNSTTGQRNYTRADLEAVNDERARTLIPAMTILAIMMLVGIVGNGLVCYVFCCRLKPGTQNFLIVCLAVLDLLSCIVGMPNEIADMRFYYIFESVGSCKIMRFINTFCAIGSIFTLVVIAVDRYRKICRPLHGQLQMVHVRLSLIPVFGGALLFGWPAFFMYGLRTTETDIPGLFGQDCSTPDNISETVFPLLYNCILFLCFIVLTISIVVIYTLVLRETKRHSRYLKRNSDFNIPSSGFYNSEESYSSGEANPVDPTPAGPHNSAETTRPTVQIEPGPVSPVAKITQTPAVYPQLIKVTALLESASNEPEMWDSQSQATVTGALTGCDDTNNTPLYPTHSALPSTSDDIQLAPNSSPIIKRSSLVSSNGSRKKGSRVVLFSDSQKNSIKIRRRLKSKTTAIAFTVSVVFIISFLPHLCLQVTKFLVKGFDTHLEGSALVAYNLFLRSYFINSVSNPFIYGALNVHFSREVKDLIKKIITKS
ncbi:unnamed protein product [Candidula unifasciata]|uniref:G-protein coupled receptors family 1 profile domain-containing protein n=1 Tax=Candidula unifasciata TaxID=100452 RepID=A0A8S3YVZ7_9EUPU|nr:unnamed protein product [Candidula unifasciata]